MMNFFESINGWLENMLNFWNNGFYKIMEFYIFFKSDRNKGRMFVDLFLLFFDFRSMV